MFVPLVYHQRNTILGSIYVLYLFVFPSLWCHPRLYLGLSVSSFRFSSKGLHPRLNLSFFSLHLVSQYWDTILCSISIYSFFIRMSGYFLFVFLPFSFCLSSLVHHPRFYLSFLFLHLSLIVCSFNFWTMGYDLRFNLSLMFVPLISHHWDSILSFIYVYSFFFCFPVIRTPS